MIMKIFIIFKISLFNLIYIIWTNYDIHIFEIWNYFILIDLYYSINPADLKPQDLIIEDWDFTKKDFKEKIEILGSFWVWLSLMTKIFSDSWKSRVVYRGLSFKTDKNYEVGKCYRFGNYF